MAEYDPTAPVTFDATDEGYFANGDDEYQFDQPEAEADDEDDDYDPSSFNFGDDENDAQANEDQEAPNPTNGASGEPARPPKTVGGFIVDDEDEEEQQEMMAPPPSQMNGTESAQSGLGAVAVSEAATTAATQDIPIASEPSQEDTTAVTSAAQSAPVNGSSSLVLPSVSNTSTAPAPASSVSAPSLQSPTIEQGKQQPAQAITSTTISAVQSAAATPQPPNAATAAPPPQTNGSVPPTPTTQRLPHDKVGQLEDRIKEDSKADTEAWRSLIQHYLEKGQIDNARKIYSRFFDVFPTAATMWVEYAQMELEQNALGNVESIFSMCLLQLPNVDMWNVYLDYLRRIHPLISDTDGTKRSIISQAFDLLLDNVGIDPDAGKLWRDYVDFLKSGPGVIGGSGWQDAQKMDLLRKAYQRAVKLPHGELTKLWKEYDNFELGINKATGRKFLQEQSPHYMTARTAKTQLDNRIEGLDRKSLPTLPPLYGCAGEDEFGLEVEKWRGWLEWEKEDPLVLKDEDIAAYRKRILYVYKQATMQLRFYPEIWFEASSWCFEQATEQMEAQGAEFLDKGMEACPESVLLALKKADRVESGLEIGNTDEIAIRNGELLDVPFENVHKALYALHKKMVERTNKSVAQVQEYYASLSPGEDNEAGAIQQQDGDEDDEDSPTQKPQSRAQQMEAQIKAVRAAAQQHQETLKRTISYVWVAKLRAFRRVQGQGQPGKPKKGFRGVFAEARPRGQLTSEVYIANALMEWRCYQDPSANKIFERGLKLFPTDEVFALEYIKHLLSNNDDTNARAVFETLLTKITNSSSITPQQQKEKCRPLLTYMHTFESNYGDLDKVQRLERRLKDMFPDEPEVSRFGSRFALPSFDALAVQLVISPTQARPKPVDFQPQVRAAPRHQAMPSIEEHGRSPPESNIRLGPNGPYIASPKRALEDSDNETPARKFMRGESPLKGAAGRRIQSQSQGPAAANNTVGGGGGGGSGFVTKSYVPSSAAAAAAAPPSPVAAPGPTPLPYVVHDLLSKIPAARHYHATLFDPGKVVELLRSVNLQSARF